MNSSQIDLILRARCRQSFLGVFACDRLPSRLPPRRPLMMVCNTDPHTLPGRHWIAIYIGEDSRAEIFDSLHDTPPSQIFVTYLNRSCRSWTSNSKQLQSAATRFCGQYCIFYCLFRSLGYSLNSIESCFTSDTGLNDVFVHAIVCKLLK